MCPFDCESANRMKVKAFQATWFTFFVPYPIPQGYMAYMRMSMARLKEDEKERRYYYRFLGFKTRYFMLVYTLRIWSQLSQNDSIKSNLPHRSWCIGYWVFLAAIIWIAANEDWNVSLRWCFDEFTWSWSNVWFGAHPGWLQIYLVISQYFHFC